MTDKPLVILFADREAAWSGKMRADLRARGTRVLEAGDVETALRQAAAAVPDLIVLDEDLDGRGGRDVAELFRESYPFAEIILTESRSPEAPRGIGQGLLYSGMKPITERTVFNLIEEAFPGRLPEPALGT